MVDYFAEGLYGEPDEDIEMAMRFAACGILSDYYYRTLV